jgi:hypothetical protein
MWKITDAGQFKALAYRAKPITVNRDDQGRSFSTYEPSALHVCTTKPKTAAGLKGLVKP